MISFLHGVPTNMKQWYPIQKPVASFCRTISFDMLGMGISDHPLEYGKDHEANLNGFKPWFWQYDTIWVEQVMQTLFPNEKFVFAADDWGGGINLHYAARFNHRLNGLIFLDPIAFDGYPVNEIQAIGRGSMIKDNKKFMEAFGTADQTIVQIFKTMVYDPNKYNQYNLRDIIGTYVDVDYERKGANSLTMGLHFDALRVLADRAAILAPDLLLPYDEKDNKFGVAYDNITVPTLVLWGEQDNMMPANQIYRYKHAMINANVQVQLIPHAGHFAGTDQPEKISEIILNYTTEKFGIKALADIFLGFTGIWKGDEETYINDLRHMYGMDIPHKAMHLVEENIPNDMGIKKTNV